MPLRHIWGWPAQGPNRAKCPRKVVEGFRKGDSLSNKTEREWSKERLQNRKFHRFYSKIGRNFPPREFQSPWSRKQGGGWWRQVTRRPSELDGHAFMAQRENSVCHLATCPQQLWSQCCGAPKREIKPSDNTLAWPSLGHLVCVIASLFLILWISLPPLAAPPPDSPVSLRRTKLKTKKVIISCQRFLSLSWVYLCSVSNTIWKENLAMKTSFTSDLCIQPTTTHRNQFITWGQWWLQLVCF